MTAMLKYAAFVVVGAVRADMQGYIVGGKEASISEFPHSSLLTVACMHPQPPQPSHWKCGSSIINQMLLLTAAHCFYNCLEGTTIVANCGSALRNSGVSRTSRNFIVHESYDPSTTIADIAMVVLLVPITFNGNIARVALMESPPYGEPAVIAGWGLIDENTMLKSQTLKQVAQKVWSPNECKLFFKNDMPDGTICGSAESADDYPSLGDSGSALVVRGYIQIGLVSFKVPSASSSAIIYTDVGYYYKWIQYNAGRLYCI